jgi:hypothetical protein
VDAAARHSIAAPTARMNDDSMSGRSLFFRWWGT